ncbi:MAG: type VI secretion system baseplate subunit TssF, partial [Desulfovibrionaceae bacterium]|nr:type VI secretion system baseplate subunit TssF [Desulfovibrionaceae bacterium]
FMLPERFCALDVTGFERWRTRGNGTGFRLELEMEDLPDDCPVFKSEHIRLFVCPAVNIFPMSGEPIKLDHQRESYRIRPSGQNTAHYQVYSVDRVTGLAQGDVEGRDYMPFLAANPGNAARPVYALSSRVDNDSLVMNIAIGRQPGALPAAEVLSLDLHCTNGSLPEKLRVGEIRIPTASSPLLAEFTNLRAPTAAALPPLGGNTLWRLLSHLYVNFLSLASAESLRSLLKLYVFGKSGDSTGQTAHLKRIDGILEATARPCEILSRGRLLRGQEVYLRVRDDNFASDGDLYIFCSVLNAFLSSYAAVNTFTRLRVADVHDRQTFHWPARLGQRTLL